MRALKGALPVAILLSVGMVVMTPPASAAPVTPAEFQAQVATAVAASGVFTRGTTVVSESRNLSSGASVLMMVNPDGSLTWSETTISGRFRVRCVRVDRCWEQSDVDFDDVRWHLLPSSSVTYRQASAFWSEWMDVPWPSGATFDVATTVTGATLFTAAFPSDDRVVAETILVSGPSVTDTVSVIGSDGSRAATSTMRLSSQSAPVAVSPPAKRFLGRPASDLTDWQAVINS